MLVCYDPYVGTLGRFSRAEIIELVAKAGYEGINLPICEPFIDGKDVVCLVLINAELSLTIIVDEANANNR